MNLYRNMFKNILALLGLSPTLVLMHTDLYFTTGYIQWYTRLGLVASMSIPVAELDIEIPAMFSFQIFKVESFV